MSNPAVMLPVFLATVVIVIIVVLGVHHYRKSFSLPAALMPKQASRAVSESDLVNTAAVGNNVRAAFLADANSPIAAAAGFSTIDRRQRLQNNLDEPKRGGVK